MRAASPNVPRVPKPVTANPDHPLIIWGRENGRPTVTALADLLDVSGPRLSQIVTRRYRPSADLLVKMNRVTGVPFEHLLDLTPAEVRAGIRAGWEKKPLKKPKRRRRAKS